MPLTIDALADKVRVANKGLALAAGPGTGPIASPGDFDIDGDVDGADFLAWQRGNSPNSGSAGDLAIWKANFGSGASTVNAGSVPEPSTLGLILVAAGVGAGLRRAPSVRVRAS
jgi:hypothetical protein